MSAADQIVQWLVGWTVVNLFGLGVLLLVLSIVVSWKRQVERYEASLSMDEQLHLAARKGKRLLRTDHALGVRHPLPSERRSA